MPHETATTVLRWRDATGLGLEHAVFEEEKLTLSPGDVIVAFSDGVTEAMNPAGEEFTDDRLLACLEAHRGAAPGALVPALLADVHAFCGDTAQGDDVTVVTVRYDGPG